MTTTNALLRDHRPVSARYQRRRIRISPPGLHGALEAAALPALHPVAPQAPRRPARPLIPRTVNGLLQTVIAAVNARGMCATQAGQIADLPTVDLDRIESLCQCQGCRRQRAH